MELRGPMLQPKESYVYTEVVSYPGFSNIPRRGTTATKKWLTHTHTHTYIYTYAYVVSKCNPYEISFSILAILQCYFDQ